MSAGRVALASLALLSALGCPNRNGLPDYPDGYREYAYIANQAGNSISVLDLVQLRPERTLGVGDAPSAILAGPTRNEIYAVSSQPDRPAGALTIIDASSNEVAARIPLGRNPTAFALSPDGNRAFIPNTGSATLTTVDLTTRRTLATTAAGHHPTAITVSPDGRTLAVTDPEAGSVLLFAVSSTNSGPILRATFSGCPGATSPVILPDSSRVFIACAAGHQVLAVGLASRPDPTDASQESDRVLALLDVGRQPDFLTLKPDGGEIFVSNLASDSVSEIATTTNEVGSTYPIGNRPLHGLVSQDNSTLWVAASGTDSVSLYSIADGKFLSSIRTGNAPDALAFASGGALLLTADTRSGDVAVIRTASKFGPALLTILPAGAHPVALAVKALSPRT